MKKTALITGITGQDSSYLVELLLKENYEVTGLDRRKSVPNGVNIEHIRDKIEVVCGDVTDPTTVTSLVKRGFDEIYNLAAQSFVGTSDDQPHLTMDVNCMGVLHFVEAIRQFSPKTKFYQAATSEMYGGLSGGPYDEESMFYPRSPYGISKLAAYWFVRHHREAYDLPMCSGILFNHESPRRGEEFVTQKICKWVKEFRYACFADPIASRKIPIRELTHMDNIESAINKHGQLELGNLEARRDWGHAKDYVRGMWMILQQEKRPMRDYVLGTGTARSVREFVEIAFLVGLGIELEWRKNEQGYDIGVIKGTGLILVQSVEKFYRPAEVNVLIADCTKAMRELRWVPEYSLEDLVEDMIHG